MPYKFTDITDLSKFESPDYTETIYKADVNDLLNNRVEGKILSEDGKYKSVKLKVYQWSQFRLLKLQSALSHFFVNYDTHIEMLLASAIAQEPILFIGPPGVAKTEMAINFFGGIGLRKPLQDLDGKKSSGKEINKYFEYLLSPFSVPDELFGTLDFKALEAGEVRHINTNMITGKLVRGVFLDEIFNASSNILNTLLTLINERRYFDNGLFKPADLKVFIGASNHSPISRDGSGGAFASKKAGELWAFYDRFTLRLYFPTPQEYYQTNEKEIRKQYRIIIDRSCDRAMEKLTLERPKEFEQIACINDLLLLGRLVGKVELPDETRELMYVMISNLATQRRKGSELCYMSPRKGNKLLPIILADAFLIPGEEFYNLEKAPQTTEILEYIDGLELRVAEKNLRTFYHIWDYEGDRDKLKDEVDMLLENV